jgi:predicted DNA-binding protein
MGASAESPNVRITPRSKAVLRALAKEEGKPMQAVLDEAIEKYQQDKLLDAMNAAYAAQRKDPGAWKQEQAERALWDQALTDGLEDE